MHKRRNATTNPYLSIDDVLNQLSDLYETPLHIQYHANHHICENLKQRTEQPFPEFYTELMRYDEDQSKRNLVSYLKHNMIRKLRKAYMTMSIEKD